MKTIEEVHAVVYAIRDADLTDELFWNTSKDGGVHVYIILNDVFDWACSDLEEIEPGDIPMLIQARDDLKAIRDGQGRYSGMDAYTWLLYSCRKRGMRPQGAYYKHVDKEVWPLLNACGPHRPSEFGNPIATPEVDS